MAARKSNATDSSKDSSNRGDGGDVLTAIQVAARGLLYPSESDKPVKPLRWQGMAGDLAPSQGSVDETTLRAAVPIPPGATVATIPFEQFFGPVATDRDWFGAAEKETARRFRDLQAVLERHLSGLQAFRVEGAHEQDRSRVDLYVLGRTQAGDLAGVSTQLDET